MHAHGQHRERTTARDLSEVEATLRLEGLQITQETRSLLRRYGAHEITMHDVLSTLKRRYVRSTTA
jgi:hypothetical protein